MCVQAQNSIAEHAMQASDESELSAADQAAAAQIEGRTAEATCHNLQEPGVGKPDQGKTGPTSGVAQAKSGIKEGTASSTGTAAWISHSAYLHDDSHSLVYS